MAIKFKSTPQVGMKPQSDFTQHLGAAKATGSVTMEKKVGKEEYKMVGGSSEDVTPPLMVPANELMMLEVEGGRTVNLGNYESARVSVSLRMPCSKADLEEAYKFATDWVSGKVEEATKGSS